MPTHREGNLIHFKFESALIFMGAFVFAMSVTLKVFQAFLLLLCRTGKRKWSKAFYFIVPHSRYVVSKMDVFDIHTAAKCVTPAQIHEII